MCEKEFPKWPFRVSKWSNEHSGYVVWRDVFEGNMQCSIERAITLHRVAIFVYESEAKNYCEYRNYMKIKYGTDDTNAIRFDE